MPAIRDKPGSAAPPAVDTHGLDLKVSAYDRASSALISLLILVGTLVFCLLVVWLSSRLFVRQKSVPVILESIGGRGDHMPGTARDAALGSADDLDQPAQDEAPDILEPQFSDTLALVTEAARQVGQRLPQEDVGTQGGVAGQGRGDSRPPGPLGEGTGDGIPRHERWEIYFISGNTLESYARQLDFFKIELGVLGPGDQVQYAGGFAQKQPSARRGEAGRERRLFMTWRKGPLQQADRELLRRSGINADGKIIVQFYPAELENQLAALEMAALGRRSLRDIRRTRFQVVQEGAGYKFQVAWQLYR